MEVDLRRLHETGAVIYFSDNNVYLTEGHDGRIPPQLVRAMYEYDSYQLGAQLFPPVSAPAAAVAGLAAAQAAVLQDVAAGVLLGAAGNDEVPAELVDLAVHALAGAARGSSAVGPSSAPAGSAASTVPQDPSAGSSGDTAVPKPAEHSLADEAEEVPLGVCVPKVAAWKGMVDTLAHQFSNLELQHDANWEALCRERDDSAGEEFREEGDGSPMRRFTDGVDDGLDKGQDEEVDFGDGEEGAPAASSRPEPDSEPGEGLQAKSPVQGEEPEATARRSVVLRAPSGVDSIVRRGQRR